MVNVSSLAALLHLFQVPFDIIVLYWNWSLWWVPGATSQAMMADFASLEPPPAFEMAVLKELIEEGFGIAAIKDWQLRSLQRLLAGQDIVVMAGTSSGKSLIFQGIVFAKKDGIVLVVAPLTSLIYDQVQNSYLTPGPGLIKIGGTNEGEGYIGGRFDKQDD
jgi:hypothetical protein